ncbi:fimbrial protein [Brucella endophytica]|uniref:Fimbrial protein n=1 Tax=Brucella endophytica TaxID=1963359 RepID=A0A916SR81_9HYPH|nr:type VI secretion system tip protein TssI/VgrG [Brucella endophytica]GGB11731.1 fimbrial protein [Brucella endophytica]
MNTQPTGGDFVQASRTLRVSSPLGENVLLAERLTVNEAVNDLFTIELVLRSKKTIAPADLIGKMVDVELEATAGQYGQNSIYRPWNGLVTTISEGPAVTRGFRHYRLTVRPQLWLLSQKSDCRIWQNQTAIDVLNTLLSEHGLPAANTGGVLGKLPPQEYSIQWNETDLDFLRRRLEEDGIYFFFIHEKGLHRLHVASHASGWLGPCDAAQGQKRVKVAMGSTDQNHISEWMRNYSYVPGVRSGGDFNFETPRFDVRATTPSLVSLPGNAKSELYEYPNRTATLDAAERDRKLRMQAAETDHNRVSGRGNVRILEPGRKFQPYEEANPDARHDEHVIIRALHEAVDKSYETNSDEPEYRNSFEAIPAGTPLTPHRTTPRPKIDGTLTGIIAGPPDEEIHVDKFGRVKLWWPWDRRAKKDGSDTKWIQVAQGVAGGTWGMSVHPRIGMQAICAFENGDPDRPYLIALVTNPVNMSPYELPANKTRTVIRSKTYKGNGFNEYSTEDAPGRENQFFHAQKDRTERVLNDRTKRIDRHEVAAIGGNRVVEVGGNQKHEIGGSLNTVVGGTGPMATLAIAGVQALSGQTAGLLSQAAQIAGGGGVGIAAFATSLASSALGFLGAGGLAAREGVVAGPSPRADQGTALAASGTGVGEDASGLFPLPGIMNTIVSTFKSDSVGVARAEQIGVSKVTNVGQTQVTNVGKEQHTTVGKKIDVKVGQLYNLVSHEKFHGEAKVWEIYSDDTILLSTKGGYIELNNSGIRLHGLKIDIEGNQINFKKGGPGEGASCLREMAKSSTPFVGV